MCNAHWVCGCVYISPSRVKFAEWITLRKYISITVFFELSETYLLQNDNKSDCAIIYLWLVCDINIEIYNILISFPLTGLKDMYTPEYCQFLWMDNFHWMQTYLIHTNPHINVEAPLRSGGPNGLLSRLELWPPGLTKSPLVGPEKKKLTCTLKIPSKRPK